MGSDTKIRVVIIGGHRLIREGLCLILAGEKCFDIVGEAHSGTQTIELISHLKTDVVLLDITLPAESGIGCTETIHIIKQKSPATKVLVLTEPNDNDSALKALKAGCCGYLAYNTTGACLVKAIKVVHGGDMWIERKLIQQYIIGNLTADSGSLRQPGNSKDILTPREKDVLRILCKGSTNKEIAENLYISEKTVKSHLNKVYKKFDVKCRLEAILHAIKNGHA